MPSVVLVLSFIATPLPSKEAKIERAGETTCYHEQGVFKEIVFAQLVTIGGVAMFGRTDPFGNLLCFVSPVLRQPRAAGLRTSQTLSKCSHGCEE